MISCNKKLKSAAKGFLCGMIEKDAYPYVFYCSSVLSEYVFIDAEGNELN